MKNTLMNAMVGLTAGLGFLGCGGLSEEDAATGWGASFAEAITLQSAAQQGARGAGETKNVACAGGGSGDVAMTAADTATTWNLDVKFNECKSATGITISGPLAWKYVVAAANITYDFTGDLEWSGEIEGDCEIALHIAATAAAGTAGGTYSGEICGYESDDVF